MERLFGRSGEQEAREVADYHARGDGDETVGKGGDGREFLDGPSRGDAGERTGTILVDNLLEMVRETPRPATK